MYTTTKSNIVGCLAEEEQPVQSSIQTEINELGYILGELNESVLRLEERLGPVLEQNVESAEKGAVQFCTPTRSSLASCIQEARNRVSITKRIVDNIYSRVDL